MNITILLLSFMLWTSLAMGATRMVEVKDHHYPVQMEAQGSSWILQGTEHFRYKAIFSVFTAALYSQKDGGGQKLQFTYTRKLKADDLRQKAIETLRNQNEQPTIEKFQALTDQIQSAYVDVKDGDTYTITVQPEKGTWLHYNGTEVFYTRDAAFGKWYLAIWLGDPPVNASLKKALLEN